MMAVVDLTRLLLYSVLWLYDWLCTCMLCTLGPPYELSHVIMYMCRTPPLVQLCDLDLYSAVYVMLSLCDEV